MAQIALVVGYSHTPYLFVPPSLWPRVRDQIRKGKPLRQDLPEEKPQELEEKFQRAMASFSALRDQIQACDADALVIVGDDQKEMFTHVCAGIAVYTGDRVEGRKYPERVRGVTGDQARIVISNHRGLAEEILWGLSKEDIDMTFFDAAENPEKEDDGFGHAFLPPLAYLTPTLELPVVPLMLNCYFPPQPTPRRCFRIGQCLKNVLSAATSVNRVVVGVSGGLWHTPGRENATIDEGLDRVFLAALESDNKNAVITLPEEKLVSGTGEIRNWIVGAGVTEGFNWQIIDYIPLYYSPIGLGFAACRMNS